MRCFFCRDKNLNKIKKINSVNILECPKCRIAFLDKNIKTKVELYSFINYQKEEKRLRHRFFKLAEIVLSFINQGKLLDVGAGFGLFSSIFWKLGNFQLAIVEPSVDPYFLKQEKIDFFHHKITYQKFLQQEKNKQYNLLLMIDILEHFKNPLTILKKTRNFLKNNGYLVIQTPNYQSLMAKICQHWSWWMVEDHKVIFSPSSLKKILRLAGYQIIYFKTYEDWYDFKKNLDGNFFKIRNRFYRKFLKLIFFSFFVPLYFLFRQLLWQLGYGGAIFLVATEYN